MPVEIITSKQSKEEADVQLGLRVEEPVCSKKSEIFSEYAGAP